jgi:hypothetical protein
MRVRTLTLLWLLLLAGCARGPKTAEQAFQLLERSIAAGDALGFYQVLDQPTQWAIQSTLRDQRLMRTIISAKYPEAEAQRVLASLRAADELDPAHYFARVNDERHIVEAYRKRLGPVSGPIQSKIDGADQVWVARQEGGMPFRFHKNSNGSWGFGELRGDWELEQDRAQHAVKTVRENAKLYQKAEEP